MVKNQSTGMKILSVVFGAIVGGFMWRCRGEGGFGSSWGLYSVGLVLMLLIYHFYSNKKGMKYEMIPLGGLMLGLGVTGYATVIHEFVGVIESDLPYFGEMLNGQKPVLEYFFENPETSEELRFVCAQVNPVSGAIIIFLMAFTLIPLFSFFVTSLFSGKEYKIRHYVTVIAIFFISSLIFKATVSHFILKLINPEQVQYAALGLKDVGLEYSSPMKAYMTHFLNRGWTQDIPFFENYYMSIEHVSDALAVIVVSLYAIIFRKDKYTGFGSLIIDILEALVVTPLTVLASGGEMHYGIYKDCDFPSWFEKISDWGVWEYLTGFFAAFFILLFLALTADKHTVNWGVDETPLLADKGGSFAYNFILTVFIFGVTPARAIALRTGGLLENLGILPDKEPFSTIFLVILAVIFGVFMIKIFKKNILEKGSNAFDMTPFDFSLVALPSYLAMCFVAYFFLDDFIISRINADITVPLMLITSALIVVIYVPTRKLLKKQNEKF